MGIALSFAVLLFFLLAHATHITSNVWLSKWTSDALLTNSTLSNTSEFVNQQYYYLGIYGGLNGTQGIA